MGPAYHPDWLVTFWLTTPILNRLNPHYVLILLAVGFTLLYFMKKKHTVEEETVDREDQAFKHLLLKKNVIEEQMGLLVQKMEKDEITKAEFERKQKEYKTHLNQVKKELQEYTI